MKENLTYNVQSTKRELKLIEDCRAFCVLSVFFFFMSPYSYDVIKTL